MIVSLIKKPGKTSGSPKADIFGEGGYPTLLSIEPFPAKLDRGPACQASHIGRRDLSSLINTARRNHAIETAAYAA
ncbi:hypothetical protein [Yoonia sp.]|uniref:hypothetical protein n=1 Tax=Yoonia sp. TaxID=2212373 RepID=UPI003975B04A